MLRHLCFRNESQFEKIHREIAGLLHQKVCANRTKTVCPSQSGQPLTLQQNVLVLGQQLKRQSAVLHHHR